MTTFEIALERAKEKLARIIKQEGDLNGERLKPYYLQELYEEQLKMQGFQAKCEIKKLLAETTASN